MKVKHAGSAPDLSKVGEGGGPSGGGKGIKRRVSAPDLGQGGSVPAATIAASMVAGNRMTDILVSGTTLAQKKVKNANFPVGERGSIPETKQIFDSTKECFERLPSAVLVRDGYGKGEEFRFAIGDINPDGNLVYGDSLKPLVTLEDARDCPAVGKENYELQREVVLETASKNVKLGVNEALMYQAFSVAPGVLTPPFGHAKHAVHDAVVMDVIINKSIHLSICKSILQICKSAYEKREGGDEFSSGECQKLRDALAKIEGGGHIFELIFQKKASTAGVHNTDYVSLPPARVIFNLQRHLNMLTTVDADYMGEFCYGLFSPTLGEVEGEHELEAAKDGMRSADLIKSKFVGVNNLEDGIDLSVFGEIEGEDYAGIFANMKEEMIKISDVLGKNPNVRKSAVLFQQWGLHVGSADDKKQRILYVQRELTNMYVGFCVQDVMKRIDILDSAIKQVDADCRRSMAINLGDFLHSFIDSEDVKVQEAFGKLGREVSTSTDDLQQKCDFIAFLGRNLSDAIIKAEEISRADYDYTLATMSQLLVADKRYRSTLSGNKLGRRSGNLSEIRLASVGVLSPTNRVHELGQATATQVELARLSRAGHRRKLSYKDFASKIYKSLLGIPTGSLVIGVGLIFLSAVLFAFGVAAVAGVAATGSAIVVGAALISIGFILIAILLPVLLVTWNAAPTILGLLVATGMVVGGRKNSGDDAELDFLEKVIDGNPGALKQYTERNSLSEVDPATNYKKTKEASRDNARIVLIQAQAAREYMDKVSLEEKQIIFDKAAEKLKRLGRSQDEYKEGPYYHPLRPADKSDDAVRLALAAGTGDADDDQRLELEGNAVPLSGLKEMIILASCLMREDPGSYSDRQRAIEELTRALADAKNLFVLAHDSAPDQRLALAKEEFLSKRALMDALRGIHGEFSRVVALPGGATT